MRRRGIEEQIAEHERLAAVFGETPVPAEADERRRRAAEHQQQATALRVELDELLRAERAANLAARDCGLVTVRFTRDLPAAADVGGYLVAAARGPVRQRLGQPTASVATVAPEAEVQLGEERVLPAAVAEVLRSYLQVLGPAEKQHAEQIEAGSAASG
jgi:hypothetical protein